MSKLRHFVTTTIEPANVSDTSNVLPRQTVKCIVSVTELRNSCVSVDCSKINTSIFSLTNLLKYC